MTHDEREALRDSARNTYRPGIAPAWLKHDRQVLRFFAYFQEPVHENPKENFRVRHCVIYFYLEDGTMMVSEPKIENAGLPQGTFVKRHRIPVPANVGSGYYTYQDLKTCMTINIYSRAFRIVGCDDFTRDFYKKSFGVDLEHSEEAPMDSFRSSQMEGPDLLASARSREINEGKEYNELALGGNRKNGKLQQYLENDRRVLRFKCYWDDPTRYGSRLYYILHYYLADDTVEMLESLARNSGRDPYPVFWRRSPLRKNPYQSPAPGMPEPEPDIYKPEDFLVGESVNVFGRDISLYDADTFTRDFYERYMGITQGAIEIVQPEPSHVTLSHPPHTGFGTEEDSLASCLHLTPRPPYRDINKLMSEADKCLRYAGKMVNGRAEDASRRFVIAIYPADDSVGVWELKQRNSGHAEGKFASKSRKKNSATGTWFCAQDFVIGSTVEINGTPFEVIGADEGTLKYMEAEENVHEFPMSNASRIAGKLAGLKEKLAGVETISTGELQQLAKTQLGWHITEHELLTLSRTCGEPSTPETQGCVVVAKLFSI
jgi:hypothetical protein